MTQTKDGWSFSMAGTQAALLDVQNSLQDLTDSSDDIERDVKNLNNDIQYSRELSSYVVIKTEDSQPCIELGAGNTDFKLRITNTAINFMQGSSIVAYINNNSLKITKAVIEEELQHGGFVWAVRSNGNLGLVWKGVSD